MSKNDIAWSRFIREKNILKEIYHPGFVYITADDLKAIGIREPRLMAKQDTLSERPSDFRQHDIAIFPVKNGQYILFRDPENRSYFKFPDNELELPVNIYQSKVDFKKFDTYPGGQNFTESQAIDFAYISSLLRTYTGEEYLNLVIRGRMFSGNFDFLLPNIKHKVNVSGVQIEVDAGYESINSIYLIEAKIGKRDDFHIRQLYYPYLEWSHRSNKQVVPIFLIYTNSKYFFYEFGFSDNFGELFLKSSICYAVNESPIAEINYPLLLRTIAVEDEPNIPYPQANDLDKVVDLLSLVKNGIDTKASISEYFEFEERQGDYYANAARYLGFLEKDENKYALTELGKILLDTKIASERTLLIFRQLLKRPTFREAIHLLFTKNQDLDLITNDEISQLLEKYTLLTGSTPPRRASTVRSWLAWIMLNGKIIT